VGHDQYEPVRDDNQQFLKDHPALQAYDERWVLTNLLSDLALTVEELVEAR